MGLGVHTADLVKLTAQVGGGEDPNCECTKGGIFKETIRNTGYIQLYFSRALVLILITKSSRKVET